MVTLQISGFVSYHTSTCSQRVLSSDMITQMTDRKDGQSMLFQFGLLISWQERVLKLKPTTDTLLNRFISTKDRPSLIRFSGAADVRGETVYQNGGKKSDAKWREESK